MRRGTHAAEDGSFSRSAGNAAVRGALLIIAAVILGLVLLSATNDDEPFAARDEAAEQDDGEESTTDDTVDTETSQPTDTTPAAQARPPAEVKVLVANGARIQGAASRRAADLAQAGYQVAGTVNTNAAMQDSRVYFTEGYEAEARALAEAQTPPVPVEGMPAEVPVADLAGANVIFVVGVANAG